MSGQEPIVNPVLPGFHPDPSILRVGDDYFIATSTFEWFPGVRIHHSRDLANWQPRGHALVRPSQLDMIGNPRSGGIWAPCLSFADGLFHLIYTDVKTWGRTFCDAHNRLVTAESIDGPWSEPIWLNSSGFDPSLFHDTDGRKWLVNMRWDHRPGHNQFSGILLQEYSPTLRKLVGPVRTIFTGTGRGLVEGPHLYRKGDYYYLLVAEGGTSWEHSISIARSRDIWGPYEVDPEAPLITSIDAPTLPIQKAGHGSLVCTQLGDWYLAHLCGRTVGETRRCNLGRETALQKLEFTNDGWFRLEQGGHNPALTVPASCLAPHPFTAEPDRDHFDVVTLGQHYQTLRRVPEESWMSLTERPGFLRLRGQDSPQSCHRQSLVARRLQHWKTRWQTSIEFSPQTFQQMAGLICMYDDENFYYLALTHDEQQGKSVQLLACAADRMRVVALAAIDAKWPSTIHLRADFDHERIAFFISQDTQQWIAVGESVDATALSDETPSKGIGFTGTFVGMCAHDMAGTMAIADFDYFDCHVFQK
jgi:xylan 1,4-beta-xylosidase